MRGNGLGGAEGPAQTHKTLRGRPALRVVRRYGVFNTVEALEDMIEFGNHEERQNPFPDAGKTYISTRVSERGQSTNQKPKP